MREWSRNFLAYVNLNLETSARGNRKIQIELLQVVRVPGVSVKLLHNCYSHSESQAIKSNRGLKGTFL